MLRRNAVEPDELDARHEDWFAFVDGHADVDGILRAVELGVEGRDARVGISAVRVKGTDPIEVVVKFHTVEIFLAAPRQLGTAVRRQHILERLLVEGVHALKFE